VLIIALRIVCEPHVSVPGYLGERGERSERSERSEASKRRVRGVAEKRG
jgi:hypothetical protein